MNLEKSKEAYNKIFKTIEKYKDLVDIDLNILKANSELHLFKLYIENCGLPVNNIYDKFYTKLKDCVYLVYLNGENRTISWPDCGTQPVGHFFKIGFSTGPLILDVTSDTFDKDYNDELFQQMFSEFKSFNPAYIDSANRSLYFRLEDAKPVYDVFDSILKKYQDLHTQSLKDKRIQNLEEQLQKLKNS